jgi:Tfp pilus assembly protein PilO
VRPAGEIWRQRLWIWVPALVFFLANAAFAIYELGYAGRIDSLNDTLSTQQAQIRELGNKRKQMETRIARVQSNEAQVQQLYTERLSTRRLRVTDVDDEVKKLAREAGLVPKAISYPEEEIEEYNLIRRSFNFSVQGTYAELRKFVNLLEASRSFLSVNEASVANSSDGPELRIDLSLSTLFARDDQDEAAPTPAETAAAGRTGRGAP